MSASEQVKQLSLTSKEEKSGNGRGLAVRAEQADEFSNQFTDVFNKSKHIQVLLANRSAPFMENIHVSAEGVTYLL